MKSIFANELPRLSREYPGSIEWTLVDVPGMDPLVGESSTILPPYSWNALIDKLDSTPLLWNWVWFIEDDIILPPNGLQVLFDRIFMYRENDEPLVIGATYQTHVFREPKKGVGRPELIPAITWQDEEKGLVKWCGWYCLLLERPALSVFPRPFLTIDPDPEKAKFFTMGQDGYMTGKLTKNGWGIVAPPEYQLPHLKVDEFKHKSLFVENWAGVHRRSAYK